MALVRTFRLDDNETYLESSTGFGGTALNAIPIGDFFVVTGSLIATSSYNFINQTFYVPLSAYSNTTTKLYFKGIDGIKTTVLDIFRASNLDEAGGAAGSGDADWTASSVDTAAANELFIAFLAGVADGVNWTITDNGVLWKLTKTTDDSNDNPKLDIDVYEGSGKTPANGSSTITLTRANILQWNNDPQATEDFYYRTKMIDFGNPATRKNIKRVDVTFKSGLSPTLTGEARHSFVQVGVLALGRDGMSDLGFSDDKSYNYSAANGLYREETSIPPDDTGNLVAQLKPATSINNIYGCSIYFRGKTDGVVPAGFTIEDITIVYKEKHA